MRGKLILLSLLLTSFSLLAQNNLDSLWGVWTDETKHDTVRAESLKAYAWYNHLRSNPDSAIYYFNLAFDLYEKHDSELGMAQMSRALGIACMFVGYFPQSLVHFQHCYQLYSKLKNTGKVTETLNNMGQVCIYLHEYSQALEYFGKALGIAQETGNDLEIASITVNIGSVYHKHGNQAMALNYYRKGLKEYERLYTEAINSNDKSQIVNTRRNIGSILNNIGLINQDLGNYEDAQVFYENSLKVKQESDSERGIAIAYLNMGNNAKEMGDFDKALDYYNLSLKKYEKLSNTGGIAYLLIYIGEIYYKTGMKTEGEEYCLRGLTIYEEIPDNLSLANSLSNIGYFLTDLGEYEKAAQYFKRAIKLQEEIPDENGLINSLDNFARSYYKQGKYYQCIPLWERSLQLADKLGILSGQKNATESLYLSYKTINNDSEALLYHERFWEITDSLNYSETNTKLQQVEFEQQQMADSLTMVQDKLMTELLFQEKLNREKLMRNTIMYAGLGILIIAGGLFGRMNYIRRTNRELEEKNRIIAHEKERAEESEKAKENLFNNISHEFRTPLTLIIGPLEEILSRPKKDSFRQEHEIMHRNTLRLQGMINELLDLSKLQFGRFKIDPNEENIVAVTQEYLQSFESLAEQRKITLSLHSEAKEYKVWLDLEQYHTILANLLSNAFKFTDEGGKVNVNISAGFSPGEGKFSGVSIKVIDTGIGIRPNKIQRVFDRFFQAGDKSFTGQAGTGIGLALTKELVELHQGTISVESKKGKGTTFIIFIPFGNENVIEEEVVTEEEIISVTEDSQTEWAIDENISGFELEEEIRKKDDKPIVLIVEDNGDMLSYIQSHLEGKYYILKAQDGEEGLAIALEKIPDLIISDVMMPKMDGNVMAEKIKGDERTSHIPIIMLTARASVDSKIESLETGADAYLTKPFNARELKVRVRNLIEQRQKLRELFAGELSIGAPLSASAKLPTMDQQFIRKAFDVVGEHLSDPDFDIQKFASEMALSRAQLHRKIKAITNKSSGDFVRMIRLNKAAELLKSESDTVTQIAYKTGFNNLSWFAKAFKGQFGVSPSEYSKST